MKKALEKGEAYIASELERLTKMSEKPMSGGCRRCRRGSCCCSCTHILQAPAPASSSMPPLLPPAAAASAGNIFTCHHQRPCLPAAAAKLDEVSAKISILSSFTEKPEEEKAPATPAEDDVDDVEDEDDKEVSEEL